MPIMSVFAAMMPVPVGKPGTLIDQIVGVVFADDVAPTRLQPVLDREICIVPLGKCDSSREMTAPRVVAVVVDFILEDVA
jgi:hypothetical protein